MHSPPLLLLFICSLHSAVALVTVTDDSARLRRELLDPQRYDPLNAPNAQTLQPLYVSMKLLTLHIYELDEFNGVLTVNGWFLASWVDYRLQWESNDYAGIYFLRVPQEHLWLPDLTLYNDADAMQMNKVGYAQLLLFRDGTIYWGAPITLKSTCAIDHKLYPFDRHTCDIDIGSWSNSDSLALDVHYLDKFHENDILNQFTSENPKWKILSREEAIINRTYACCPNHVYPYFKLQLSVQRQTPFYKYLFITPGVVCMLLTLGVFWLPVNGYVNAKIAVGGVTIIVQIIMLNFIAWEIPSGGKSIPAFVLFCGNSMVMTGLSILATIALTKIIKQSLPVPSIVQTLCNIFGKCLCLQSNNSNLWARFLSSVSRSSKDDSQLLENSQVEVGAGENGHVSEACRSVNEQWLEVGVAFDRICFLLYTFVFACICFASFV